MSSTPTFHNPATDAEMAHVGRLSRLRQLYIRRSPVSDAGLAHLEGLTELTFTLEITETPVSDTGLAHLKGLTDLTDLNIACTGATDTGLGMHLEAA